MPKILSDTKISISPKSFLRFSEKSENVFIMLEQCEIDSTTCKIQRKYDGLPARAGFGYAGHSLTPATRLPSTVAKRVDQDKVGFI